MDKKNFIYFFESQPAFTLTERGYDDILKFSFVVSRHLVLSLLLGSGGLYRVQAFQGKVVTMAL